MIISIKKYLEICYFKEQKQRSMFIKLPLNQTKKKNQNKKAKVKRLQIPK